MQPVLLIAIYLVLALGLACLFGGAILYARARVMRGRCSAQAAGTVVDVEDAHADEARRKAQKSAEAANQVIAANEAIAAKKRAYQAKKNAQNLAQEHESSHTWHAVVEYEVGGQTLRARTVRAGTRASFRVGAPAQVFYDPAKPSRCWLDLDGLPLSLGFTVMGCGAALVALGALFLYLYPSLVEGIAIAGM